MPLVLPHIFSAQLMYATATIAFAVLMPHQTQHILVAAITVELQ